MDSYEEMIVPEVPKALPNEQLFIYVPTASSDNLGVAKFDNEHFSVDPDGTVHLQSLGKSGIITIPASEWTDASPTIASVTVSGVDSGSIILMLPADEETRLTASNARLSAYPTMFMPVLGNSSVSILRAEAEIVPDADMTFAYIVLKTGFSFTTPLAAIIGVDAYGEDGAASGVDETAVKAIITAMLGNVDNERQYSASNPPPYPVTSVNGKTGAVSLYIPSEASDVKADPEGTAQTLVNNLARKTAQDLANYYTKSQTLTKDEINALVSAIPKFNIEVVTTLPTSNISDTTVYLVKSGDDDTNLYTEYIRANDAWERLGTQTVDLTGYATEAWVNELIAACVKTADMEAYVSGLLKSYITKDDADNTYQPVGDYADRKTTEQALSGKQPKGDYLTREVADQAYQPKGAASTGSATVEIILPSSDVAVVGREYNLYHSAFIYSDLSTDALDISVTVSGGGQGLNYHECFRMTPTTAGEYNLTVMVRDKLCNATITQKTMTLFVVENALDTVNNILILGDSYTDAGYYPAELQHNLSGGKIVSLGTVTDTVTINNKSLTVTHEGHSGWATWDFAGNYADSLNKFNSDTNKFRNPTTNKFDLGYYLDTYHNGANITAIMLNLGENGVGANPTNIEGFVELVARIRDYSATLPILIHMTIPQSPQDTKKTGGKYTSNYMARLWRDLMARLITEFDGVANVHLVPVHAVLDMEHDLPTESVPVCARNTATIVRPCDGHPSKIGYLKMADVYYAHLLKYMGEGEPIPEEPDEPTVTNLLDFSVATTSPVTTATPQNEFAVGYKISASNLSVDAQAYTTNTFALTKGQKIKVEGIKLTNTGFTNYFRWWFFNADGSRPYGSYVNFTSDEGAPVDCVEVDSSNNCATIDTSLMNTTFDNITHARFSFVPSGEYTDTVVKIIEEDEA